MKWDVGYSASFYMTEVDPVTWKDKGRIEITNGSINRQTTGLRQSADVTCIDYSQNEERWVRIYLDAKQADTGAHEALFTGLAVSPDRDIKGFWYENKVQCYSVLKPADDVIITRGWFASTAVSCSRIIKDLLSPIFAPVEFEDTETPLSNPIVAQAGETNLTMVERLLTAMNWNMNITGDGRVIIGEYPAESSMVFDAINFDVIENAVTVNKDWYSCPNVFMASNNFTSAIAKDEDDASPLSIQNRGREIWMYEDGVVINQGESMETYAKRRLKEEQDYLTTVSYDRRYVPGIYPNDIITLYYPAQELSGDFLITSQKIDLGYSARTSESIVGITS